jgi:hypothetical protein
MIARQARMLANMNAWREEMKDGRKDTTACQEEPET